MLQGALWTNISDTLSRYPIDQLGNLVNATIISYAILKYRLLDIKLVLRRGLAYTVLSIVLTASYLLALYFIQRTWDLTLQASVVPAGLLALVMALVFIPLRDIAQDRVDRIFYRDTYNYRKMLLEFSRQAASTFSLDELSREMLRLIVTALRASWGAILSPDAVNMELRTDYLESHEGEVVHREVRLRQDNPLVARMSREGRVLMRETIDAVPEWRGLWETEREELQDMDVGLLCPVLTRGNLTGIIVLGSKEEERPYTEEEADLLLTIATGAAVAIENARMLWSLRQRERAYNQLLSRVVSAQEEERQRIAADLHDGVAQWLIRASYQTQVASALTSDPSKDGLTQELSGLEDTIDASVKELRRVLAGLRPPALEELGLPHAVKKEVDMLRSDGIIGHLDLEGEPMRPSPSVGIATYRVVQEALNNVRRHSKATKVDVVIHFDKERLRIHVTDDGIGFNVSQMMSGAVSVGQMGLLGMRQRAESLGGDLKIESREGRGTRIVLLVPFNEEG